MFRFSSVHLVPFISSNPYSVRLSEIVLYFCDVCTFFFMTLFPQLKEQATDSISVLEGALQLKKDFYVHTLRTLDMLAADAAANGETESSTAGLRISADELHCQVGGLYSSDVLLLMMFFYFIF